MILADMTALFVGLIVLLIGVGGFTADWYRLGRDPPADQTEDPLPSPPDGLSPGMAGVLLEEEVLFHHVLASLFDLAQRGVIRICAPGASDARNGSTPDVHYEVVMIDPVRPLSPYEDAVLFAIFGQSGRSRQQGMLAELGPNQVIDHDEAQAIAHAFYGELIDRQYFDESPRATRRRWYKIACGYMFTVVAGMIVLAFTRLMDGVGNNMLIATITLVVMSILYGFAVAQQMPARTRQGANAVVRLKAFRRYLDQLVERRVPRITQQDYERLLPYVVSLRRDPRLLRGFLAYGYAMPTWFDGDADTLLQLHATAALIFTTNMKGGRTFAE